MQPAIVENITLAMAMLYLAFDYGKHFFFNLEYSLLCTGNHRVLSPISLDSPGAMYLKSNSIYLKNVHLPSTHDLHRGSLKLMRWLPDHEMKGENVAEGYYFISFFKIYIIYDVYNILYMVYYMLYIIF